MKRVLGLSVAVAVFTLGISARAEAVPSLVLRICQGFTCVNIGPGVAFVTSVPIVVGDYLVSASASALESPTVSNSQTTSIQVQRVGSTSAAPLEIWLAVTGYVLPVAPELVFSTTFAATASAGADPADATYQGWYSATSSSFIPGPPTAPPADGITAGPIGCVVGGANVRRPGSMACSAFPPASVDVAAAVPFSLVTRTTFNILTPSAATYGSTAQANVRVAP